MTNLIFIVIILACIALAFFILIQKPKGGGLSGAFGSIGTQIMGVKQSGDVMEKSTWYTMALIAALSIATIFSYGIRKPASAPANNNANTEQQAPASQQQQQPAQQQMPQPVSPATPAN